jgi:hypothetical protein
MDTACSFSCPAGMLQHELEVGVGGLTWDVALRNREKHTESVPEAGKCDMGCLQNGVGGPPVLSGSEFIVHPVMSIVECCPMSLVWLPTGRSGKALIQ